MSASWCSVALTSSINARVSGSALIASRMACSTPKLSMSCVLLARHTAEQEGDRQRQLRVPLVTRGPRQGEHALRRFEGMSSKGTQPGTSQPRRCAGVNTYDSHTKDGGVELTSLNTTKSPGWAIVCGTGRHTTSNPHTQHQQIRAKTLAEHAAAGSVELCASACSQHSGLFAAHTRGLHEQHHQLLLSPTLRMLTGFEGSCVSVVTGMLKYCWWLMYRWDTGAAADAGQQQRDEGE
jgi:hypothetical protein